MLASMPWRIWRGWIEYAKVEPFGEERADLRAGIIAATVANCMARGKGKPAFRPSQFMPKFNAEPRSRFVSPEEQLKKIIITTRMLGGEVRHVEGPIGDRSKWLQR
jgi:hypothetical protein